MRILRCLPATLMLATAMTPISCAAETLRILQGDLENPVMIPIDGSVILEPDDVLETAIANPRVVHTQTLSMTEISLTGKTEGRTTLTIIDQDQQVTNVELHVAQDAATPQRRTVPARPPAILLDIETDPTASIVLPVGGAIVLKSDVLFQSFEIDDQSYAVGSMFWEGSMYLLGLAPGETTLRLLRADGAPATNVMIEVNPYPE